MTWLKDGKRTKRKYYLEKVGKKWLINWVVSAGWSNPTLTAIKIRRYEYTNKTKKFPWVIGSVKLDDYFNYKYSRVKKVAYSIRFDTYDSEVWLYVLKDSPLGRSIFKLLKDGSKHNVAVQIYYNTKLMDRDDKGTNAQIVRFITLDPED